MFADAPAQPCFAASRHPALALGRGIEKRALLAEEVALELGAGKEGRQPHVAAGGVQREAVERAGEQPAIDDLGLRLAIDARDLRNG